MKNKTYEKCGECGHAVEVTAQVKEASFNTFANLIAFIQILLVTLWHSIVAHFLGGGFFVWFAWFIVNAFTWLIFFMRLARLDQKQEDK